MEKKTYETPAMEVIDLPSVPRLLDGSPWQLNGDSADDPADLG